MIDMSSSSEETCNQPLPLSGSHVPSETSNEASEQQNEIVADNPFQKKKRTKTSKVWLEFTEVVNPSGTKRAKCNHFPRGACHAEKWLHFTSETTSR